MTCAARSAAFLGRACTLTLKTEPEIGYGHAYLPETEPGPRVVYVPGLALYVSEIECSA